MKFETIDFHLLSKVLHVILYCHQLITVRLLCTLNSNTSRLNSKFANTMTFSLKIFPLYPHHMESKDNALLEVFQPQMKQTVCVVIFNKCGPMFPCGETITGSVCSETLQYQGAFKYYAILLGRVGRSPKYYKRSHRGWGVLKNITEDHNHKGRESWH